MLAAPLIAWLGLTVLCLLCCRVLCHAVLLLLQPVVMESSTDEPGYTTISGAPAAVLGGINAAAARAIWLEDHLADVSAVFLCLEGGMFMGLRGWGGGWGKGEGGRVWGEGVHIVLCAYWEGSMQLQPGPYGWRTTWQT
jgi:hypothetical protein